MKEKTSKFKQNDIVRVLPDVKDPDFKTNINGWVGKIEDIEVSENGSWLYRIKWNDKTIKKAGDDYIDKCEDENLDFEVMYLEEKELELINDPEAVKNGHFFA